MNALSFRQVILPLALMVSLLAGASLQAREIEFWPYERLRSQADLIVIATPGTSEDSGELVFSPLWQLDFVGVNTPLQIKGVLHGRFRDRQLTLFHLRMPDGKTLLNGPAIIKFRQGAVDLRTAGRELKLKQPEYLLFLRKRDDGRYEPVSGPLDAVHSIREVHKPVEKP